MIDLKALIREIPDYPKPGILFYDLTTLLKDPAGFHSLVDQLCEQYNGTKVEKNSPGKLPLSPTNSNTAPTSSNSTKTPSSLARLS
jgi:hypothetical protein